MTSTSARVELLRSDSLPGETPAEVAYDARVELGAEVRQGRARVDSTGAVQLAFEGGNPPPWVLVWMRALLRAKWREREHGWPRRLTRWKAAPEREAP